MARTIGLLRVLAMDTAQPDKLLEQLNERLCVGNETNLFVTMFCGFLDLQSGAMCYSNGGHCAPVLSAPGNARCLPIPKGALVGAFPGLRYLAMTHTLAPGEMLFCYTDGVTEAENGAGEQYSEERCVQFLQGAGVMPLAALLDAVRDDVAAFKDSKLLDDDCTMLAFKRPDLGAIAAAAPV
jgi:sigma-B regulation protein RsbU (phosphoserine phosphatase)